ncbi:MAG: hypothetical protein WCA28_12440 [Bradyrhizobium sp.]
MRDRIENVGKWRLDESGKYPVNKNDEGNLRDPVFRRGFVAGSRANFISPIAIPGNAKHRTRNDNESHLSAQSMKRKCPGQSPGITPF